MAAVGSVEPHVLMLDGVHLAGRDAFNAFAKQLLIAGDVRAAIFPLDDRALAVALAKIADSLLERGYVATLWYGAIDDFIERHRRGPEG